MIKSLETIEKVMHAATPHTVLRLPPDQTPPPAQIKRVYRQLCLELHPDRCHVERAEEAFKRVQAAYEALTNGGPWEKIVVAAQPAGSQPSRKGRRPPGSTSGARWGHGAAAPRGQKPTNIYCEPEKTTHRKGPSTSLPKKAGLPSRPKATSASPSGAPKVYASFGFADDTPGEAARQRDPMEV